MGIQRTSGIGRSYNAAGKADLTGPGVGWGISRRAVSLSPILDLVAIRTGPRTPSFARTQFKADEQPIDRRAGALCVLTG
jgi:hypothetical protein